MSTFRRLSGPPAEMPEDDQTVVPCVDCQWCCVHRSRLFNEGNWSNWQRNLFEVFWQKIQHFKFEYACGMHVLGRCDSKTFDGFMEMATIRGLYWERGVAYYVEV